MYILMKELDHPARARARALLPRGGAHARRRRGALVGHPRVHRGLELGLAGEDVHGLCPSPGVTTSASARRAWYLRERRFRGLAP